MWLRGLIKPAEGRALAYIDWKSQEVYIAAQLSGDPALLDAVLSGDPYLAFAKMAGLAPPDATKQSHKAIRDMCKTCVLGTNYGMQAQSLAMRTGLSVIEAQDLLRRLALTFPVFTAWAEHVVDVAQLTGHLSTVFGWTLRTENTPRTTSLRNFPDAGQRRRDAAAGVLSGHRARRRRLRAGARRAARRRRRRPDATRRWRPPRRRWPRRRRSCSAGSRSGPTWRSSSGPTGTPIRAAG